MPLSKVEPSFPPLHYARLRRFKKSLVVELVVLLGGGLGATTFYFLHPLSPGTWVPIMWAIVIFRLWSWWAGMKAMQRPQVILYFPKRKPSVKGTLLSGYALARCWTPLEVAAQSGACEPLSSFGLEDENETSSLEWFDAKRGLETTAFLLCDVELPADVRADLNRIETALRDATHKNVPFRLLLRADDGISWAEMDIRQGYF